MAEASNEKAKLYTVIALSVVALGLAYFRFMRKPGQTDLPKPVAAVAESMYEIPALPAWLSNDSHFLATDRLPYTPPVRDLFAPADAAPAKSPSGETPGEGPPAKRRADRPFLSAVMMGPQGRMAFIDDELVKVGATVGKYTVAEIRQQYVILQRGTRRYILKIGE